MNIRLLSTAVFTLVFAGCVISTSGKAKEMPRKIDKTDSYQTIMSAELDELTRAFADRYVGLLSSACDALKKENSDVVQRREAQQLLVNGATNVYDIASNADAYTRVLDLIVVTTLTSQVWIDDDRATEVFGNRAEVLIQALHHGRQEAWALAIKVLRTDQLDLLDYLLWDWRQRNPDMVRVYSVRFSNFAIGRGQTADAEVLRAGGLFGNVGQAGQAIEEARQLTERMFYQLKRMPTLLRWQTEALQDTTIATPEVGQLFADIHHMTEQADKFAADRKSLLKALDKSIMQADATIANTKAALIDANKLVASLEPAGDSLNKMFKTADTLVARFETFGKQNKDTPTPPFDIEEYTTAMKELATTAGKVNEVLESSNELLGSSEWDRRLQQLSESADEQVKKAYKQSQQVVNSFFWQAYSALAVLFVLFLICLVTAFVLMLQVIKKISRNSVRLSPDGSFGVSDNTDARVILDKKSKKGGA